MGLAEFVIVLAVLGFALWLVLTYIPMPGPIKNVIVAVVALAMVVLVLQLVGINTGLNIKL